MLSTDQYRAFGTPTTTASATDCFGFGGQFGDYTDGASHLVLCTHRYYDPAAGRFLTRDPIGYAGGLNLYAYCGNNAVNDSDPSGYADAISAYNYWMGVAVDGESQGGVAGNAQAAGASLMTACIDFFGARNVQAAATASGTAAGNGDTAGAKAYGALAFGEIVLSATVGWTGGGGSAATGVGLRDVGWYELGSQTIKGSVYTGLEAAGKTADKVTLGKTLVKDYGWRETLLHPGKLRPGLTDWSKTLREGPTPGGYVGMNVFVRTGQQVGTNFCDKG